MDGVTACTLESKQDINIYTHTHIYNSGLAFIYAHDFIINIKALTIIFKLIILKITQIHVNNRD